MVPRKEPQSNSLGLGLVSESFNFHQGSISTGGTRQRARASVTDWLAIQRGGLRVCVPSPTDSKLAPPGRWDTAARANQ